MSKKSRHIVASCLLLLFIWQVTFLCTSYKFQNESISAQTAYFVEELQEDHDLTNNFLGGIDFEEVDDAEEDYQLMETNYHFVLIQKRPVYHSDEVLDPKEHFQNPYSPPEMFS